MLRLTTSSIVALSVFSATAAQAQSLEGMWRLVGAETQNGPDAGSVEAQGGMLAYGGDHFLWVLDINQDARPMPVEAASDSEIVDAIEGFTAVSGTYERDGQEIRYFWETSMNPSSVSQNQPQVRQIVSLTEDRLVTGATNGEGITTTLVYERVQ